MTWMLLSLALASTPCELAGTENCAPVDPEGILQYDDGSAWFLHYDEPYRGTWFHLEDFYSDPQGFEVEAVEFWFYHHLGCYGLYWPTDFFGADLCSGGSAGPTLALDESRGVAIHMSASYHNYSDPVTVGNDFWFVIELSDWNGTPSPISDQYSLDQPHSFHSDDMKLWEPTFAGDYLFRIHGSPRLALAGDTWGGIKSLFVLSDR